MKKTICLVLTILTILLFVGFDQQSVYAKEKCAYEIKVNGNMTKIVTGKDVDKNACLTVSVDSISGGNIILKYAGQKYIGYCAGDVVELKTKNGIGHYAYYSGELSSQNGAIYIDLDTYYINDEMFATLTSYDEETEERMVLCFGEVSSRISCLTSEYERVSNIENKDNCTAYNCEESNNVRSNYERSFQGYSTTKFGNYVVATMSVIHQNNLRNGSNAEVDVKVNTNTSNVNTYLCNSLGVTATMVSIYQVETVVYGNESDWNIPSGSFEPVNSSTSFTMPLYFWAGNALGIQSINVTVDTTTTSVQRTHYSSTVNFGKITWILKKTLGFPANSYDGSYSSNKGFPFAVDLRFHGNVSNNISTTVNCKSKITYKYKYYWDGDIISGSISTSYCSKTTHITVEP
jgi:hypothetical protein